jgi:hypothetical protein
MSKMQARMGGKLLGGEMVSMCGGCLWWGGMGEMREMEGRVGNVLCATRHDGGVEMEGRL